MRDERRAHRPSHSERLTSGKLTQRWFRNGSHRMMYRPSVSDNTVWLLVIPRLTSGALCSIFSRSNLRCTNPERERYTYPHMLYKGAHDKRRDHSALHLHWLTSCDVSARRNG
jgi:hypothetical protein